MNFFDRTGEKPFKVMTYRGTANGWEQRTIKFDRVAATRFLVLLNRVENDRLHKVVAA